MNLTYNANITLNRKVTDQQLEVLKDALCMCEFIPILYTETLESKLSGCTCIPFCPARCLVNRAMPATALRLFQISLSEIKDKEDSIHMGSTSQRT